MTQYKCLKCGYSGPELIFQFNDYTYCVASNEEEPEYIKKYPKWVSSKSSGGGDAEIVSPVGCPRCHAWGVGNFGAIS